MSSIPVIYRKLGLLFLLGVLFHTLARFTFFLWNLKSYSGASGLSVFEGFLWGLRFDASATAAILAPAFLVVLFFWPWLRGRGGNWLVFALTILPLVPLLAINFIDIEMINIAGRRFSAGTLFLFREVQGKASGMFWDYSAMILAVIAMLIFLIFLCWKVISARDLASSARALTRRWHFIYGFGFLLLMVLASRGGLQLKPLSFAHAQIFQSSWLNSLVMNSSFSIIKSANQDSLTRYQFFRNSDERNGHLNGLIPGLSALEGRRLKTPQNVVVIILESFSLEYMGKVNGDSGYTPFLDSLAEKSLFFSKAVANGRRSIEGVPAILMGIPTLMDEPFITSPFANNKILRMPQLLKTQGYHTSFFHGGHNGTMYFDSMTSGLGIDHYFGYNEYPDKGDDDENWGIYDEPFFQFFAKNLSQFPQPFFSSFFSLSSHPPYKIPKKYLPKFSDGPVPILKAVAYADYSLRRFFDAVQNEPWYKDTLFIITADHTQLGYRKDFRNDVSKYRIPILFFHPKYKWPPLDQSEIVQQIDIPLSILDFLGISPTEAVPLGRSVFAAGDKAATVYLDGRYFLIAKDYFLSWFPGQDAKMYASEDRFQENELQEPVERKKWLIKKLQAQIEMHNSGMLDNALTFPTPQQAIQE